MEIEEFFAQYKNLAGKIGELRAKEQSFLADETAALKFQIERLESMHGIIFNLKSDNFHEKFLDNKPAHYFVSAITDDDIVRSDKPLLQLPCPRCKIPHDVLMSYEKVFNDGKIGVWEKQAFIICPDFFEMHKLQNYSSPYEF